MKKNKIKTDLPFDIKPKKHQKNKVPRKTYSVNMLSASCRNDFEYADESYKNIKEDHHEIIGGKIVKNQSPYTPIPVFTVPSSKHNIKLIYLNKFFIKFNIFLDSTTSSKFTLDLSKLITDFNEKITFYPHTPLTNAEKIALFCFTVHSNNKYIQAVHLVRSFNNIHILLTKVEPIDPVYDKPIQFAFQTKILFDHHIPFQITSVTGNSNTANMMPPSQYFFNITPVSTAISIPLKPYLQENHAPVSTPKPYSTMCIPNISPSHFGNTLQNIEFINPSNDTIESTTSPKPTTNYDMQFPQLIPNTVTSPCHTLKQTFPNIKKPNIYPAHIPVQQVKPRLARSVSPLRSILRPAISKKKPKPNFPLKFDLSPLLENLVEIDKDFSQLECVTINSTSNNLPNLENLTICALTKQLYVENEPLATITSSNPKIYSQFYILNEKNVWETVVGLFDTGSDISLLEESCMNRTFSQKYIKNNLVKAKTNVNSFTDTKIIIKGILHIEINFYRNQEKKLVPFLIYEGNKSTNILLGNDIISLFKINLKFSPTHSPELYVNNNKIISFYISPDLINTCHGRFKLSAYERKMFYFDVSPAFIMLSNEKILVYEKFNDKFFISATLSPYLNRNKVAVAITNRTNKKIDKHIRLSIKSVPANHEIYDNKNWPPPPILLIT